MGLKSYTTPRTTIQLDPSNSIAVRGLNLEDISFLVQVHKGDVDAVVEAFKGRVGTDATPDGVTKAVQEQGEAMLLNLLQQFPLLAANVIAVAADEVDAWENAGALPLPKQVEAIFAIAKLTFEDVDGFKKFVGNVLAVVQSVGKQKPRSKTPKTKSTGSTD